MPSWRSSPGLKAGTTPNGSSPDWAWAAQTNTKQRSTLTPPTSTPPSRLETRNGASNKAGDPHAEVVHRAGVAGGGGLLVPVAGLVQLGRVQSGGEQQAGLPRVFRTVELCEFMPR